MNPPFVHNFSLITKPVIDRYVTRYVVNDLCAVTTAYSSVLMMIVAAVVFYSLLLIGYMTFCENVCNALFPMVQVDELDGNDNGVEENNVGVAEDTVITEVDLTFIQPIYIVHSTINERVVRSVRRQLARLDQTLIGTLEIHLGSAGGVPSACLDIAIMLHSYRSKGGRLNIIASDMIGSSALIICLVADSVIVTKETCFNSINHVDFSSESMLEVYLSELSRRKFIGISRLNLEQIRQLEKLLFNWSTPSYSYHYDDLVDLLQLRLVSNNVYVKVTEEATYIVPDMDDDLDDDIDLDGDAEAESDEESEYSYDSDENTRDKID